MVLRKFRWATTAALMNAMTVGLTSTYSSTAIESMRAGKLNIDDSEASWIGSILPLGAIIGGIVAGWLSDRIGRKGVMVYQALFLVAGWLMIAYANSLSLIYAGRFITGLCSGLICVVTPMYIVEISTSETRGDLGTRFQLFICSGIITSSVCGKFLPWQWVAIVGGIVGFLALLAIITVPESPQWLVMKNQQAAAVHAVNFLYGSTNDPSVNELVNESFSLASSQNKLAPREIILPTIYKPALLSIGLMFFQQFSGSNAILYYTVSIFKQASSSIDPAMGFLWVALVMYWFTFLTSRIIDIIGRKKSLYISGFITFISMAAMGIYLFLCTQNPTLKKTFGWVPLLCLIVYIAGFSIGLGPIPWLMMSEMSPIRGRSLICGLGTAFSWLFVFIITKTFLQIEDLVGNFGAYWIYSGFCLLACFFTLYFIPETKGKSLEEIENHFAGGDPQLKPLPELSNEELAVQDN